MITELAELAEVASTGTAAAAAVGARAADHAADQLAPGRGCRVPCHVACHPAQFRQGKRAAHEELGEVTSTDQVVGLTRVSTVNLFGERHHLANPRAVCLTPHRGWREKNLSPRGGRHGARPRRP